MLGFEPVYLLKLTQSLTYIGGSGSLAESHVFVIVFNEYPVAHDLIWQIGSVLLFVHSCVSHSPTFDLLQDVSQLDNPTVLVVPFEPVAPLGWHALHEDWPLELVILPIAQSTHVVPLLSEGLNLPSLHFTHSAYKFTVVLAFVLKSSNFPIALATSWFVANAVLAFIFVVEVVLPTNQSLVPWYPPLDRFQKHSLVHE